VSTIDKKKNSNNSTNYNTNVSYFIYLCNSDKSLARNKELMINDKIILSNANGSYEVNELKALIKFYLLHYRI